MAARKNAELATRSFGRCLVRGDLFDRFYEVFLGSHPSIPPYFANTDFTVQKQLLRHGINFALMMAKGDSIATQALSKIRSTHSKSKLNIPPRLYGYWKNSFLQAVSEIDPKFGDEGLSDAWEEVLEETVEYVAGGYDLEDDE